MALRLSGAYGYPAGLTSSYAAQPVTYAAQPVSYATVAQPVLTQSVVRAPV
jgi:hypothetical protein